MKKIGKLRFIANAALLLCAACIWIACFIPYSVGVSSVTENVYYEGDTSSNKVSLMFNVYQNASAVYDILDILDKFSVKSTFFIGGCWADDNADCLREIVERGHEVGNHGYFHKDHDKLSAEESNNEISLCHRLVLLTAGVNMNLFAPPSGAYNASVAEGAAQLGYKCVMWTVDTVDWRDNDEDIIYSRAIKAKGGSLVLMHPMSGTVKALERVITYYVKNSLSVCTVSDNISTV